MVTVQRSSCALVMRTANVNRQNRMKVILFTFVKFQISYLASLERLFLALRGTIFTQSEFSNLKSQISNLQCPLLADGHNVSGFLAEDDNGHLIAGEEVFGERHVGS